MNENEGWKRWGKLGRAEIRKKILAYYSNKCQVCGRIFDKNNGWYPHIHHKTYEYEFNIENFELLCKVCHGKRHPKSKFYYIHDSTPPCTQGNIHCKDCPDYFDSSCGWSLPIEKPIRECTSIDDIEILLKYIQSESPNDRRLAAKALGKLSDNRPKINDAVPYLIDLLKDDFPRVRRYAIKALGEIGEKSCLNILANISNDVTEIDHIRNAAMLAIKKIEMKKQTQLRLDII